jgi:hypothetical protein
MRGEAERGMSRRRTKLAMSAAEAAQLKERIRLASDPRDKERLQAVLWAIRGQHTLADLAQLAGRARSTIQVWLDDFTQGGLAQFRFLPWVSLELSRGFLQQIADSDPQAEHVDIWDQAGFHPRPEDAQLPARIHLLSLPPYSPQLNPVEGLWDQTQDVTCNQHFTNLDHLEEVLTQALRPFGETPARVLSLVHHWLHDQANAAA